ncbi:MAG: LysR family transcriptional regulator [Peptococcaceae bacterium]|nr:LysR family transcriptional regulator [Peptococcaceae bacterium]MBQ6852641.1 LysR family transcriptional regulator [Peptococcaceae bacterium]
MRIEQLQYFESLIQEGSFTKAAEQLHIAQPTLTASIKAMEKELDTKLLNRDSGALTLTENGEKVLRFAQAVLKLHDNLLEEIKRSATYANETITVFASNFFYKIILENFLPDFFSKKQINIRPIDLNFSTSLELFYMHNCNFAIISRLTAEDKSECVPEMLTSDEKFFYTDLTYIPIFQSKFGACMSSSSSLLYAEPFTPLSVQAAKHPMTMFPNPQFKVSDRVLFASSTIAPHIQAIKENKAICNIPHFAYEYYFAQENGIVFRPYSNNIIHTYYLIYPKGHSLTQAEQIFVEELAAYLTQLKSK